MSKNLTALIKKRDRIEQEIVRAERLERRKNDVLVMPEFAKILNLPDAILRAAFVKIATENPQQP